ncbi:hypothetical protein I302_101381 [Kwoniella bestiolae CBS 10118]|uniref:Uncharacterized protein n=1 Tax=Kwoniella bestiolae CBS 10118 TaxID=1296100 RepID=A0A1B9GC24_9TREE|nr:hypothetical protein I302_00064 [Kwoniella bestiolae CBS 10118]OCF28576.1 hypothetical protein I302_00064 [Kwoniella bestiolae CBS 10118]
MYLRAVRLLDYDDEFYRTIGLDNLILDPFEHFKLYPNLIKVYNIDSSLTREISFSGEMELIYWPRHEESLFRGPEFNDDSDWEEDYLTYRPIISFSLYDSALEEFKEEERSTEFTEILVDRLDELNELDGIFEEFSHKGKHLSNLSLLQAFEAIVLRGHPPPVNLALSHWDPDLSDLLKFCGSSLKGLNITGPKPFTPAEICEQIPWAHLPKIKWITVSYKPNIYDFGSQQSNEELLALDRASSNFPSNPRDNRIRLYFDVVYNDDARHHTDSQIEHHYAMRDCLVSKMKHFVEIQDDDLDHPWCDIPSPFFP